MIFRHHDWKCGGSGDSGHGGGRVSGRSLNIFPRHVSVDMDSLYSVSMSSMSHRIFLRRAWMT